MTRLHLRPTTRAASLTVASALALMSLACSGDGPGSADGMTTTSNGGTADTSSSEASGTSGSSEDSSTGDPTDTDPGTDTGPGFIPGTDTGIFDPDCDVAAQDCPDGEKCVPVLGSGDLTQCVPVTGDGTIGEACTIADGADDCDGEHLCLDGMDGDGEGFCAPLCLDTGAGPSCPDGTTCTMAGFCIGDRCNPLEPDPCANDWPCVGRVGDGGARCSYGEGASYGDVAIGEACTQNTDCAEGSACTDGLAVPDCASEFCCTTWCDPTDMDSCTGQVGTLCIAGMMMMMTADYGRCVL